ncbi:hypothetical protein QBC34DRAFT_339605 [Podospora aff. communis PSN243]|uniref:Lytic polysaccharide monooxygenase n=1 Tax=Podospora aff. communis PSN243 TaxID=3040156 RepID=A0AAV9G327_9PEZI|nr:hypothetical protein QBC34DRAFT_339605 [Podospora aff. communis PSN243]
MMITVMMVALLGLANGHMIMNTPTPYNYRTQPWVMVHPLREPELNLPFPCQGSTHIDEITHMTAGQPQLVKFTGGGQHGGGSCQFSLTYEYPPPADISKWKTIYTIIGGCPTGYEGNLPVIGTDQDGRAEGPQCPEPDSPRTDCIRSFNIPIPKDVPSGNATFAWTWFNKIGNREYYMNCAPVSITGGSSDTAFFDSLPTMFAANMPGLPTCFKGSEGVLNIPNPGRFGRVLEPPKLDVAGTCSNVTEPPVFEDPSAPPAVPALEGNMPGPATTAQAPPPPPAVTKIQVPSPAVPTTLLTVTRSSSSSTASTTLSAPPTPSGNFICVEETHFGTCNNGLAIPQSVAAGTKCVDGVIVRVN